MKCTKVLNLAVVYSYPETFFIFVSLLKWPIPQNKRHEISHVMRKMIIDDSAFLFNQREKA